MNTYLSDEIRGWLRPAVEAPRARPVPGRRVRAALWTVRSGGASWPVVRRVPGGFVLALDGGTWPRGLVDLYEGERHAMQCLVVGAACEGGEATFEYKRATLAREAAPVDFEVAD